MQPGLIIVSNRLPLSVKKIDGKLEFYPSIGGLATGLSSFTASRRNKWIGWPGLPNEELSEQDKHDITAELRRHNCYPVFLSRKQLNDYYNIFSNSLLWPIFHDLQIREPIGENYWRTYKRVNKLFADAVLALSETGSTVWVHDYQLLLLPGMLRKARPEDKIGFFLHIPFPAVQYLQQIPHAIELVNGMLGSDLVGFHTESYVDNFKTAIAEYQSGDVGSDEVVVADRIVRVTDFPMGIDYAKFIRATKTRAIKRELSRLKRRYGTKKIILTVDRLDPTKGLVERMQAYQQLLRENPELHRKVVMVMIATPSRTEIDTYRELKKRLESLVKVVNAEFGTKSWQPVDYKYVALPFEKLAPYFQLADVAFIAPLRDGMNLVAKEYIASRKNGVLVLSSTAGAAQELKDAIIVHPHRKGSLTKGLKKALSLPKPELHRRASRLHKRVSEFTVHEWAGSFMTTLRASKPAPSWTRALNRSRQQELVDAFRHARKRLILLDHDGVLVPLQNNPKRASPSAKLIRLLARIAADDQTELVIISGRSKADLDKWFGDLPVSLAAEHGAFIRMAGRKRWQALGYAEHDWKETILPILEAFTKKTPGTTLEQKDAAIVWHYRAAKPYHAQKNLVALRRMLSRHAKQSGLQINQGKMILEIRKAGVDKGTATTRWLESNPSFILAIGDDYTDEDMFEALPDWAHSIKVGRGRTKARLRITHSEQVLQLLERLAKYL
jgi:trehalose 6-phosphate synthase/phosphatase